MQKISTKGRGVRALVATGVVGAGLVLSGVAGTVAGSSPNYYDPCQPWVLDATQAYYPCDSPTTRNTIPENQTTTTLVRETTTTTTPRETTTTMVRETTTTAPGETTTTAPAETTTTRPGAAAAAAARPVAAQATYTG